MSVIRCDSCDRFVDLDYDSEPVYNEDDNTWTCGICQEKEEEMLEGEGETKTFIKTRVRQECENCGEPATQKHTYLNDGPTGARNNPASSAYGRDDCTWCSDYDLYLCDDCKRISYEVNIPRYYHWCSTFKIERMPHLFLCWEEQEVEQPVEDVA